MKLYVLDANALIRYLTSGKDGEKVRALFVKTGTDEVKLLISVINWGEALYILAKILGLPKAISALSELRTSLESVAVSESETVSAVTLRHNYKLSYADSFAAALTMRLNATLVTADPDFAKLGKKLKVMALARYNS